MRQIQKRHRRDGKMTVPSQIREVRAQALRSLGEHRIQRCLAEHSISVPTDQIEAIAHFLRTRVARLDEGWFESDPSMIEAGLMDLLRESLEDFDAAQYLRPLSDLAAVINPIVEWDLYASFARLIDFGGAPYNSGVGSRLRSHFPISPTELDVLAEEFRERVLVPAVRAFDTVRGAGVSWPG